MCRMVLFSPNRQATIPASHATFPIMELDRRKLLKEVAEARRMADAAATEEDRRFWLRMADEWSKLVLGASPSSGREPWGS